MINKIKLNRYHIEALVLILIFSVFLWFGLATSWQHKISHDIPINFRAADAFWNTIFAEHLKNRGSYDVYGPYYSGGYKDAAAYLPPITYHIAVILSNASGMEVYDSIYFMLIFSMLFIVLSAYILIRKFNWHVAVLSLPICFLIFTPPYTTVLSWGIWSFLFGSLFIIPIFFSLATFELDKAWLIFTGLMLGLMLTNFPQFVIVGLFIFLYLLVKFFQNKSSFFSCIRKLFFSLAIIFVLSLNWLIVFAFTLGSSVPLLSTAPPKQSAVGFAVVLFSSMGFLRWLIFLGMAVSIIFLLKKKSFPLYVFLFMFLLGFANYFGLGKRSLQLRFLWPVYFSIFIGILIYFVFKSIIRRYHYIYTISAFIVLLILVIKIFYPGPITGGILDSSHWDALMWIKDNTDENSKVMYFYGDSFGQKSLLAYSERLSYLIKVPDIVESLQNNTIRRDLLSELIGERSSGFAYRKSAFSFGYHAIEDSETNIVIGNKRRDICSFYDYFVFDKFSSYQPAFIQFNMIVRDELIKHDFKEVFSNNIVSVLQNTDKGADCIG